MIKEMEGKENKAIRKALAEAGIPMKVIDELAPSEKEAAATAAAEKK